MCLDRLINRQVEASLQALTTSQRVGGFVRYFPRGLANMRASKGVVIILIGTGLLVFNRPNAKAAFDFLLRIRQSSILPGVPVTERNMRTGYCIASLGLVIFGLLLVFGIIE